MKKFSTVMAVMLVLLIFAAMAPPAAALSLSVGGERVSGAAVLYNSTTYVQIRAVSEKLYPGAKVSWENRTAIVKTPSLTITAKPGDYYIQANGRMLYADDGIKLVNGSVLVPVRVLAKAFGAEVYWDANSKSVTVTRGSGTITSGDKYYDSDSVYWLSRIINAESAGEPLKGKIAVGNVILNRVASKEYPNTIYGVIFDRKWGVQFQPVANGTIYNTPTAESVLAAKLCLDGASVAGESLFFLNPAISTNFWIMETRKFYTKIGNHHFYL